MEHKDRMKIKDFIDLLEIFKDDAIIELSGFNGDNGIISTLTVYKNENSCFFNEDGIEIMRFFEEDYA